MLKVETSTMICCTWLIDSWNIAKEVSHIAGKKILIFGRDMLMWKQEDSDGADVVKGRN